VALHEKHEKFNFKPMIFYKRNQKTNSLFKEKRFIFLNEKAESNESNSKKNEEKAEDNKENMIPQSRLNQVLDKSKELESKLAEFQAKETEREAKSKTEAEAEAVKKGEFEKVLKSKDEELGILKAKLEKNQTSLTDYESEVEKILKSKIEKIPKENKSLLDALPSNISNVHLLRFVEANESKLIGKINVGNGGGNPQGEEIDTKEKTFNTLIQKKEKGEKLSFMEERELMKTAREITLKKRESKT